MQTFLHNGHKTVVLGSFTCVLTITDYSCRLVDCLAASFLVWYQRACWCVRVARMTSSTATSRTQKECASDVCHITPAVSLGPVMVAYIAYSHVHIVSWSLTRVNAVYIYRLVTLAAKICRDAVTGFGPMKLVFRRKIQGLSSSTVPLHVCR